MADNNADENFDIDELIRKAEALNREEDEKRKHRDTEAVNPPLSPAADSVIRIPQSSSPPFPPRNAVPNEHRQTSSSVGKSPTQPTLSGPPLKPTVEANRIKATSPNFPTPSAQPFQPRQSVQPGQFMQSASAIKPGQYTAVLKPRSRLIGLLLGLPILPTALFGFQHFYFRRPWWGLGTLIAMIVVSDSPRFLAVLLCYLAVEWIMMLAGANRYKRDGKGVPIK